MKLTIAVLLLSISLSQAFNPWGIFKKWKGEVEEALDSNDNKDHAERFLKEVKDRKGELMKEHEELGQDVMNKAHKVWKKTQDLEIIPTEPYEHEIKPTEPEILPTDAEEVSEEPKPTEFSEEIEPTEESETVHPTEEYVVPEKVVEPNDEYVEPVEINEPEYVEPMFTPEAPVVPPTDEPDVDSPEHPTEDLQLIEEPIEGNKSSDEDDEDDFSLEKDNDDDDDSENESSEEEQLPEEPQPVEEQVKPQVELTKNEDEIEVEDIDVAPKDLWKEIGEKSFGKKWLQKKQHKLRKLWRKFAEKHSESILNKIRKLENKIAHKREE